MKYIFTIALMTSLFTSMAFASGPEGQASSECLQMAESESRVNTKAGDASSEIVKIVKPVTIIQ